jgi:hypothetical protein
MRKFLLVFTAALFVVFVSMAFAQDKEKAQTTTSTKVGVKELKHPVASSVSSADSTKAMKSHMKMGKEKGRGHERGMQSGTKCESSGKGNSCCCCCCCCCGHGKEMKGDKDGKCCETEKKGTKD